MKKIGCALLIFSVSSLVYGLEDAPRTREYERCIDRANAVSEAILECVTQEYARQGKRLNATYRNLLGSLNGDRRRQLIEIQRRWDKYTQANCELFTNADDNASDRIRAAECKLTARIERAVELEELAKY